MKDDQIYNREDVANKLREVFAGLAPEEKMQALLDVLKPNEVIQIPSWIIANAVVGLKAKKAVITVRGGAFTLEFIAGKGKALVFDGSKANKEE